MMDWYFIKINHDKSCQIRSKVYGNSRICLHCKFHTLLLIIEKKKKNPESTSLVDLKSMNMTRLYYWHNSLIYDSAHPID